MEAPSNQGELSLVDFIISLKSNSTEHEQPSAVIALELNEERKRRQECEKRLQELNVQFSSIQQEYKVGQAAILRKDSLLFQARNQWIKMEEDYKQKLQSSNQENQKLLQQVKDLESRLQSTEEQYNRTKQDFTVMTNNFNRMDKEMTDIQCENQKLKSDCAKYENEMRQMQVKCDTYERDNKSLEGKLEEYQRECCRLKGVMEDLNREKNYLQVELDLFQERFDSNRQQWEAHCRTRVQEAVRLAEEEADRKLNSWQNEVETKMRSLVTTLEQQLGKLKEKSLEETRSMELRHQEEMNVMKNRCSTLQQQIEQQQKEQAELTSRLRQLLEAQWSTVNQLSSPCQVFPSASTPAASVDREWSSSSSKSSDILTKRSEIHQYVSQIMERHNGPNGTNPVHIRKKV